MPYFKKVLFVTLLFYCSTFAQFFYQNFDTTETLANYISTTPHAGQFNYASSYVSISNGELRLSRSVGNSAVVRSTAFTPAPNTMVVRFRLRANTAAVSTQDKAATIYICSNPASNTNTESSYFGRIAIGIGANGSGFRLTSYTPQRSSDVFSGTRTVSWYINKTGAITGYRGPDNAMHYISQFTMQAYIDTVLALDSILVNSTSVPITGFKIVFNSGGGDIYFDDLEITGNNTGILPVELSSFTAGTDHGNAVLRWITATENNNYGFEIYRSPDKSSWQYLGFVAGSGNSYSPKAYQYTDYSAPQGMQYYHLRQIDNNGAFTRSPVCSVLVGSDKSGLAVDVYPNPCTSQLRIAYHLPAQQSVMIKITNILGETVLNEQVKEECAGDHQVIFPIKSVPSGCYIVTVKTAEKTSVKKVVCVH